MRLAIFGVTGGIGGHLLSWAMDAGHPVHALARDPAALPPRPGLAVTGGDVLDAAAVAAVIAGTDAVLSALGPRGARVSSMLAGAAANITGAMAKSGARRLICVSAAGAYITEDPRANPLARAILPRILARQFADVREMEEVIRSGGLQWTLVRATRLVNGPLTGRYRVSPDYPQRGGRKISRADVAHFMAASLTEVSWLDSAPALAY